jgi:hypothetical protein
LKYVAGAVTSSVFLLLFVAAVHYSASAPPVGPKWTVTGSIGTHHMLVVDVTAHPSASLREIGESVVKPVLGQYDEVLIYVRSGKSTLRRIQWTPQHGYAELLISR